MHLTRLGHAVFAVALAGFGVLSLVSGDFAYVWQFVRYGSLAARPWPTLRARSCSAAARDFSGRRHASEPPWC